MVRWRLSERQRLSDEGIENEALLSRRRGRLNRRRLRGPSRRRGIDEICRRSAGRHGWRGRHLLGHRAIGRWIERAFATAGRERKGKDERHRERPPNA